MIALDTVLILCLIALVPIYFYFSRKNDNIKHLNRMLDIERNALKSYKVINNLLIDENQRQKNTIRGLSAELLKHSEANKNVAMPPLRKKDTIQ